MIESLRAEDFVQVSSCWATVWVFGEDVSTVGRFSKRFGMDVHTTFVEQLEGKPECLHCTHAAAGLDDWLMFCDLIAKHYGVAVPRVSVEFS